VGFDVVGGNQSIFPRVTFRSLALALLLLLLVSPMSSIAQARVNLVSLGQNYFCSVNDIARSSKVVKRIAGKNTKISFSKARTALKASVKRAANSRTKKLLRRVLASLNLCSQGGFLRALPTATSTAMPVVTATPTPTATPIDRCLNSEFHWQVHRAGLPPVNTSASSHMLNDRAKLVNFGWAGLWPRIEGEIGHYTNVNGGIPQNINMSAHLADVVDDLTRWFITDRNFDGLIILDFEVWQQWDWLWNESDGSMSRYKQASIDYVQALNPGLSGSDLLAEAKRSWNAAALAVYLETQRAIKAAYPQAKVAYYLLMLKTYHAPYHGPQGDRYRALNDEWIQIHQESDMIVPDLYQFYMSEGDGQPARPANGIWWNHIGWNPAAPNSHVWYDENRRFVKDNVLEAKRIAHAVGDKPVYVYLWPRYHDAAPPQYRYELNHQTELYLQLIYPLRFGVKGVVLWGYETPGSSGDMQDYYNNEIAPMLENYCGTRSPYYQELFDRLSQGDALDESLGLVFSSPYQP
jgi:hypothetical protein